MKLLLALLVAFALTGVVAPAYAADEKPAQKADAKKKNVRGEIVKIDGSSLTIKVKQKGAEAKEVVVTTDTNTQFLIEGTPSKLSDLKVGQIIVASPAEGTAVKVAVPKPKEKKPAK